MACHAASLALRTFQDEFAAAQLKAAAAAAEEQYIAPPFGPPTKKPTKAPTGKTVHQQGARPLTLYASFIPQPPTEHDPQAMMETEEALAKLKRTGANAQLDHK